MKVPIGECYAERSKVVHNDGNSIAYSEILNRTTIDRVFSEEELKAIELKKFGEYKIVGKSLPALDIPTKINGTARYGIDVFVPNMVYGRIVPWPTRFGAKPRNVDDSAAKSIDGYIDVFVAKNDDTGVNTSYVIAIGETYWAAEKAIKVIKVDWDNGPNEDINSESLRKFAVEAQKNEKSGLSYLKEGNFENAIKVVDIKHKAIYETSTAYHGIMEPMNCVAMEKDGIWHLFNASQWQTRMTHMVAYAVGVEDTKVVHHQCYAGGGFGRRLEPDVAIAASVTAKYVGRPVKLIYSREDDMMYDFHRSYTYQVIEGGLKNKKISAIKHDVCAGWSLQRAAPGWMQDSVDKKGKVDRTATEGSNHWYDIPNQHVRAIQNNLVDRAVPPGFLRAVAPAWTFFAVESYFDEIAKKSKQDPLLFRLAHLVAEGKNKGGSKTTIGGSKRLRNVLLVATGRAGYGVKILKKNEGMGIACISSQTRKAPSWTACVAEVKVNSVTGEVKVKKISIAMDLGTVINPDGAIAQIEGSVLYGLSLALYENITVKNGSIEQTNFDTWTPIRLNQAPEIEVILIQNGHYPVGAGEPAVTVIAPAIANAIHDAVGARVRSLPITPELVKRELREV